MLLIDLLLVLTAIAGSLAAGFWLRVAASRSLLEAGRLNGKEQPVARANRRALAGAAIASGLTLLLAAAVYLIGRDLGGF